MGTSAVTMNRAIGNTPDGWIAKFQYTTVTNAATSTDYTTWLADCPEGQMWRIRTVYMNVGTTDGKPNALGIYRVGDPYYPMFAINPGSTTEWVWLPNDPNSVIMWPGDRPILRTTGITNGGTLFMAVWWDVRLADPRLQL